MSKLSKLNVASWALLVGAGGQALFYWLIFPRVPAWVIWPLLLLPWMAIFTMSFCNQPPFGPRPFRLVLVLAMCWYATAIFIAEILHFLIPTAPAEHFSFEATRLLIYPGALSFIVFVRFCIAVRGFEAQNQA